MISYDPERLKMQMKKRTIALGLVGLVVLTSLLYFVVIPRVNATGTGTVTAYPNEAHLLFSVRTQNQSAANAAAQNGVIMTNVFASLSALGVNKSDIKTTGYSLSPAYDSYNYSKVVGYVAVNSVEVLVNGTENLPNVGKIIDAVVKAGVNQVDGISFTYNDSSYNDLQAQAYRKAVQDANSQASAIVSGLGGVIIGVASVSTNYGYGIMPQPISYGGTTETKPPTPINSGPQQVTATVNITYLYI
jgi:uncharacterized protein YggE